MMEFCSAVRAIGFCGSLKTLWNELDSDGTGMVSLDEICPEAGALTTEFRRRLIVHGGGHLVLAWKGLLDTDGSGRVEKQEFLDCCQKIHFSGDARKLFGWYDYDHSGYITLEEIDPVAYQQLQRGDDERGLLVLDGQSHERGGAFAPTEGSKRR